MRTGLRGRRSKHSAGECGAERGRPNGSSAARSSAGVVGMLDVAAASSGARAVDTRARRQRRGGPASAAATPAKGLAAATCCERGAMVSTAVNKDSRSCQLISRAHVAEREPDFSHASGFLLYIGITSTPGAPFRFHSVSNVRLRFSEPVLGVGCPEPVPSRLETWKDLLQNVP